MFPRLSKRSEIMTLTSPDCFAKDVFIASVVVSELKFRDVERHVFGADFVEGADNAALKDAPEALDGVGMDSTDDVLALCVIDDTVRELFAERAIAAPCIGAEQADFLGNRAAHESGKGCGIDVLD